MNKIYEYDAVIQKHDGIDAAFVEFPYNVEQEFGTKGQVKVFATFDGFEYRGSLAKMGHHCHCLGMTQALRSAIGKSHGDKVHVIINQDTEPRIIEIPEDFNKMLLENEEARNFFEGLSYTNKKEYVGWITSAKKEETRSNRLVTSIEMLLRKTKHP